ncbi:hypothetical protein P154DRAFT_529044 [Amniculicola lignicola CBS 123094]|uniref:Uncharacterized protein n=1 Tax=Amniculicola lignicola CBS 123094 TaxID=1392246 RepID=A0A6A5X3C5_9PLEO|nr:hypothetical protein P154DRAFT_529044 [Amniculicola lignicola CBS 123094]
MPVGRMARADTEPDPKPGEDSESPPIDIGRRSTGPISRQLTRIPTLSLNSMPTSSSEGSVVIEEPIDDVEPVVRKATTVRDVTGQPTRVPTAREGKLEEERPEQLDDTEEPEEDFEPVELVLRKHVTTQVIPRKPSRVPTPRDGFTAPVERKLTTTPELKPTRQPTRIPTPIERQPTLQQEQQEPSDETLSSSQSTIIEYTPEETEPIAPVLRERATTEVFGPPTRTPTTVEELKARFERTPILPTEGEPLEVALFRQPTSRNPSVVSALERRVTSEPVSRKPTLFPSRRSSVVPELERLPTFNFEESLVDVATSRKPTKRQSLASEPMVESVTEEPSEGVPTSRKVTLSPFRRPSAAPTIDREPTLSLQQKMVEEADEELLQDVASSRKSTVAISRKQTGMEKPELLEEGSSDVAPSRRPTTIASRKPTRVSPRPSALIEGDHGPAPRTPISIFRQPSHTATLSPQGIVQRKVVEDPEEETDLLEGKVDDAVLPASRRASDLISRQPIRVPTVVQQRQDESILEVPEPPAPPSTPSTPEEDIADVQDEPPASLQTTSTPPPLLRQPTPPTGENEVPPEVENYQRVVEHQSSNSPELVPDAERARSPTANLSREPSSLAPPQQSVNEELTTIPLSRVAETQEPQEDTLVARKTSFVPEPITRATTRTTFPSQSERKFSSAPGIVAPPVDAVQRDIQPVVGRPPKARKPVNYPPEEQDPPAPAYPTRDTPMWIKPDVHEPPSKLKVEPPTKVKEKKGFFGWGSKPKEEPQPPQPEARPLEPLRDKPRMEPFRSAAPGPAPGAAPGGTLQRPREQRPPPGYEPYEPSYPHSRDPRPVSIPTRRYDDYPRPPPAPAFARKDDYYPRLAPVTVPREINYPREYSRPAIAPIRRDVYSRPPPLPARDDYAGPAPAPIRRDIYSQPPDSSPRTDYPRAAFLPVRRDVYPQPPLPQPRAENPSNFDNHPRGGPENPFSYQPSPSAVHRQAQEPSRFGPQPQEALRHQAPAHFRPQASVSLSRQKFEHEPIRARQAPQDEARARPFQGDPRSGFQAQRTPTIREAQAARNRGREAPEARNEIPPARQSESTPRPTRLDRRSTTGQGEDGGRPTQKGTHTPAQGSQKQEREARRRSSAASRKVQAEEEPEDYEEENFRDADTGLPHQDEGGRDRRHSFDGTSAEDFESSTELPARVASTRDADFRRLGTATGSTAASTRRAEARQRSSTASETTVTPQNASTRRPTRRDSGASFTRKPTIRNTDRRDSATGESISTRIRGPTVASRRPSTALDRERRRSSTEGAPASSKGPPRTARVPSTARAHTLAFQPRHEGRRTSTTEEPQGETGGDIEYRSREREIERNGRLGARKGTQGTGDAGFGATKRFGVRSESGEREEGEGERASNTTASGMGARQDTARTRAESTSPDVGERPSPPARTATAAARTIPDSPCPRRTFTTPLSVPISSISQQKIIPIPPDPVSTQGPTPTQIPSSPNPRRTFTHPGKIPSPVSSLSANNPPSSISSGSTATRAKQQGSWKLGFGRKNSGLAANAGKGAKSLDATKRSGVGATGIEEGAGPGLGSGKGDRPGTGIGRDGKGPQSKGPVGKVGAKIAQGSSGLRGRWGWGWGKG